MVDELKSMGIELMVSVWPTVEARSPLFPVMKAKGLLVTSDRGVQVNLDFMGNTTFFDATHPQAREFVWETVKKNYYDLGIKLFWLDEAEPEYRAYDFDNYRYHAGPVLEVGINIRGISPRVFMTVCKPAVSAISLTWYAAPGRVASVLACWPGPVMCIHRSMHFVTSSPPG
jgi:alpha-glucosidase (family GH31 glycosyl hydrolase)